MSNYVGAVGDKISTEVTLVNRYEYTDYKFSYYGNTHYIYTMKDSDGNVYVWKSTSIMGLVMKDDSLKGGHFIRKDDTYFIRKGDVIQIKGTVKDHSEYNGTKQTVLTRCKVVDLVEVALTETEIAERKAKAQMESLQDGDFIWKMPYRQYKTHYSDCETVAGSFDRHLDSRGIPCSDPTVKVIIRKGRLKASGVRGKSFYWFTFETDKGGKVAYWAVSQENARKQMLKEYPNSEDWELFNVTSGR